MLTAGVYFQYEAKHRCRTKFENQSSTYSFIEESDIIQSLTPRRMKNNETLYDSCNLVRFFYPDTVILSISYLWPISVRKLRVQTFVFQYDYDFIDPQLCVNGTNSNSVLIDEETCIEVSSNVVECENFVYETEKIQTTIATENNLVCKNHWISKIITFTTMVGMVIGPTFSGMISDKIGRIMTIGEAQKC